MPRDVLYREVVLHVGVFRRIVVPVIVPPVPVLPAPVVVVPARLVLIRPVPIVLPVPVVVLPVRMLVTVLAVRGYFRMLLKVLN